MLYLTTRCDVDQAVDYNPAEHRPFGYVTSLTIGEINIMPDLRCVAAAPVAPTSDASVTSMLEIVAPQAATLRRPGTAVGVLTDLAWDATPTG
nr:hypothetical protein [Micromonospora sp. DSM 115978]